MNWETKRAALIADASKIVDEAKAADRALTDDERTKLDEITTEVKSGDEHAEKAKRDGDLFQSIAGLGAKSRRGAGERGAGMEAKSLGEHFVASTEDDRSEVKGNRFAVTAPEFKAPNTIGGWTAGAPVLTDYDRTVVRAKRDRPVIADLLGSGAISGNAISYFVEGALTGDFGTVAEGATKPELEFGTPTAVVDALKKIAGWTKFSDELIEDADFLKTEIDVRMLYRLAMVEETQLLNGNGSGQNILGLLNRSGVQTETAAAAEDEADALFRAMTKVSTATDLTADGIVINPLDYQSFRLNKDGNGQYFGGGYFTGQYGVGGVPEQPPLWGLRTIVTPAIAAGTVLVGAFSQGATVYRKGGVRVDAANTNQDDFINNLVTLRVEERIALAVRYPSAFVKVSLAA
ncbi:phage major capsid protein [Dietzia sp. ANT_WB102]|uniref:phage major capsid protein n=1 Tax=Dietzia sp. ANT_WB102 TaxID=2597345 RepID=UPI0011F0346C|nr:phage major capsid protein [Dietzia sp. ANT_WB102]KAA0916457.1 phage major capsid protein [Dietzia sp. ANT_WB102]